MSTDMWTELEDNELIAAMRRDADSVAESIVNVRDGLRNGWYGTEFVDFVQQEYGWNASRMWVFALMWANLLSGEYAVFTVPVGNMPSGDRDLAANQAKLRSGLPSEFSYRLSCNNQQNGDGRLIWDIEIGAQRYFHDPSGKQEDRTEVTWLKPGSALLEVGSQPAGRTWSELRRFRSLARWCYGSTTIFVVVNLATPQKHPPP